MSRLGSSFLLGLAIGVSGMVFVRLFTDSVGTAPVSNRSIAAPEKPRAGSAVSARVSVVALGTIEPRDGIVQISSPLVGFQIKSVLVQDGQVVKAGEVLIELDPASAVAEHELALSQRAEALETQKAKVAQAKEQVATAELAVQQATDGRQLELDAQESKINVAAAKKKQADRDLERFEKLRKLPEPLMTEQQVESQRVVVEAAAAEHEAAKVGLKRLEQQLNFQQQTTAAELRVALQALSQAEKGTGIESLTRRVELAELKLKQATIVAPAAGTILSVNAHPGESIAQQPLVQIADLDNLTCVAELDSGDVPYLQTNQKATVGCRAFHEATIEGTVDRVGNQIAKTSLRPVDPRKPVDHDVTKVVVLIDAKKAAALINAALINAAGKDRRAALVGLQVEVTFPLTKPSSDAERAKN